MVQTVDLLCRGLFGCDRPQWLAGCARLTTRVCASPQDIEKVLEPILFLYKQRRRPAESLGDFTARVGFDALRAYSQVRSFLLRQGGVGVQSHSGLSSLGFFWHLRGTLLILVSRGCVGFISYSLSCALFLSLSVIEQGQGLETASEVGSASASLPGLQLASVLTRMRMLAIGL